MSRTSRRATRLLASFGALAAILACGGSSDESATESTDETTTEAQPADRAQIASVVFARELDAQWNPVGGPVTEFRADESTVWARITIRGRPRAGTVTMRWMWRDLQLATADIDLADVNGGLLFSFGQDTYIKGYVTARQLYIGDGHRLVLMQDGVELGSYPFRVVPPAGARPSSFSAAALYRSFNDQTGPSDPTTTFAPSEPIIVAGQVALGNRSWFDARFTLNGAVDNTLTMEAIGPADGGDVRNFHFRRTPPAAGWPPGAHRVELILDDRTVATYDFTVSGPVPPG